MFQAERYMQEIPESQRPISGSEGAQRRREQLERQVPLHDVDPSHCHSLSEAEISGFESYRQHLREGAVGQGRVATLAAMLKELRLPYAVTPQEVTSMPNKKLEPLRMDNNNPDDSFPPPPSPETLSHLQNNEFPSPPAPPLPNTMPPTFMQRPSAFLPKPFQKPAAISTMTNDPNRNIPMYPLGHPLIPETQDNKECVDPQQELFDKKKQDMDRLQQDIQIGSRGFQDRSQLGLNFPQPLPMIEEVKSPGFESDPITNQPVRATRFDNNNAAGELPGELAGKYSLFFIYLL
jgi:hypothetical protein